MMSRNLTPILCALFVCATPAIGCDSPASDRNGPDAAGPDATAPDTDQPDEVPPPPGELVLSAIDPAEGRTDGLEQVSITGYELGQVTDVLFGDAPALDVFAVSDRLVVCLTPPNARGLVDVTVIDAEGRKDTLPFAFNYRDPVQITGVEPAEGHWLGGEPVTIYGSGFVAGSVVLIGGHAAPKVDVVDTYTLTLVTPQGVAGPADVHVSAPDGVARLRGGFTYIGEPLPPAPGVRIDRVSPARGPAAGGTAITVEGAGFAAGATLRIGALPARNISVQQGGTRITAVTPAGSLGPNDVHVIASGGVTTLADGFTFEGPPAVWAVDPPSGSIAGGTFVRLRGHGFPASGVEVYFGSSRATSVSVESDGVIVARTPPGDIGRVPVAVRGGGFDASHPSGFVYFDPAANPGTWGEPIAGALNVTVLESSSGARVPSAVVLVGDAVHSKYRGFTDVNGQITFSGDDLLGEQRVTVSVPGYQIFQMGGFDAENVTIPVDKIPTCADIADIPCDAVVGPARSANLEATIIGSNKGPTIPFGACRDWPDAPNGLCAACSTDADCQNVDGGDGGGLSGGEFGTFGPSRCTELGGEGSFCSSGCETDADCPGEFVCLDPSGVDEDRRCVPPPGEWAAYCNITETDMWTDPAFPYPGVVAHADRTFEMQVRLGNFAFYCWGGEIVRTEFRPRYLGVVRGLGAFTDGETITTEVKLDIPLDERVTFEIERPTLGPVSDEKTLLRTILNLGGDGVLEFPPRIGVNGRRFSLMVPAKLDGVLYDATWDVYAQVEVPSLNGGSAALEPNLVDLNPVIDYAYDGSAWKPMKGFDETILDMAVVRAASGGGDGTEALVAVGEGGLVARSFNGIWAQQQGGTDRDLHSVAVAPAPDSDGVQRVLIGGVGGYVAHWDGWRWVTGTSGVVATVEGLAFADATSAWAVAGPALLHWDGTVWTTAYAASVELHGVAADATRVWAVGELGVVVRGESGVFEELPTGAAALRDAWLSPDGRLVVVGDGGSIQESTDGRTFERVASGTDHDLETVWGRSADEVWAAGARATILRREAGAWRDESPTETRGTIHALGGIAGSDVLALGAHELVLGPLLGIPEQFNPAPGNTLGDDLTWTARAGILPHFTVLDIGSEVGPCSACGFMFMIPYSEWRTVLDGDLFSAKYPEFSSVSGALPLSWGVKGIAIYRVRLEDGFDFDHTASTGFYGEQWGWRAWSWRNEAWYR